MNEPRSSRRKMTRSNMERALKRIRAECIQIVEARVPHSATNARHRAVLKFQEQQARMVIEQMVDFIRWIDEPENGL